VSGSICKPTDNVSEIEKLLILAVISIEIDVDSYLPEALKSRAEVKHRKRNETDARSTMACIVKEDDCNSS
jgi:hypothetical protein